MSIEDSINHYHKKLARVVMLDLLGELLLPKEHPEFAYRLKDDAVYRIADRLERDGAVFDAHGSRAWANRLYKEFHLSPLMQVGYGMLNLNMPTEIARQLTPYELMFAYAGAWAGKATTVQSQQFHDRNLRRMTLYQIVRKLTLGGINRMKYVHNERHRKGFYKNRLDKLPHEAEVRSRLVVPRYKTVAQMKQGGQLKLFE